MKVRTDHLRKGDFFRLTEFDHAYMVLEVGLKTLKALYLGTGSAPRTFFYADSGAFHDPISPNLPDLEEVILLNNDEVNEMLKQIDADINYYSQRDLESMLAVITFKVSQWTERDFMDAVRNGERMQ